MKRFLTQREETSLFVISKFVTFNKYSDLCPFCINLNFNVRNCFSFLQTAGDNKTCFVVITVVFKINLINNSSD